jgi:hypothetical protein
LVKKYGRNWRVTVAKTKSKFEGYRKYTVEGYDYLVTYFQAGFKGTGSPKGVADQFTIFVETYADAGYEFYRTDSVPYEVSPGCLYAAFGVKSTYGYATIVTFRKKAVETV